MDRCVRVATIHVGFRSEVVPLGGWDYFLAVLKVTDAAGPAPIAFLALMSMR